MDRAGGSCPVLLPGSPSSMTGWQSAHLPCHHSHLLSGRGIGQSGWIVRAEIPSLSLSLARTHSLALTHSHARTHSLSLPLTLALPLTLTPSWAERVDRAGGKRSGWEAGGSGVGGAPWATLNPKPSTLNPQP